MIAAVAAYPLAGYARQYAAAGWRIFPIRPRTKRPLRAHGSADATNDAHQVNAWWRRWPWASIGALVPAGLVVVDLDPRNGCTLRPATLPETLTARSGGGGWHLYYRAPGEPLAAHASTLPGVDLIRADGQIIVPPSIHPSGHRYEWTLDVKPVPLPTRLVAAFARPVYTRASTTAPRVAGSGYVNAARAGIVDDLGQSATPGNRWRALTAAALRYRDLGLSVDDALDDLLPAMPTAADFTEHEARRTIESVWR